MGREEIQDQAELACHGAVQHRLGLYFRKCSVLSHEDTEASSGQGHK